MLLFAVTLFTGCTKDNSIDDPSVNIVSEDDSDPIDYSNTAFQNIGMNESQRNVKMIYNHFALDMADKIESREANNYLISPLSFYFVCSMLANTDDSPARDEVLELIKYNSPNLSCEDVNSYCKLMLSAFPNLDSTTQMNLANAIWFDNKFPLNNLFISRINDVFGNNNDIAKQFTSITKEERIREVNEWVSQQTLGSIKELFKEKESLAMDMTLVNACVFKGYWEHEFDEQDTYKDKFHNCDNSKSKIEFMPKDLFESLYSEFKGFQCIRLDFGNCQYSSLFILPPESQTQSLDYDILSKLEENLDLKSLTLALPKFSVETRIDNLMDYYPNQFKDLRHSGLKGIYSDHNKSLCINLIRQVSKFTVSEKGAEIASATGSNDIMDGGPISTTDVIDLKFDRPFYYVIRENSTGTILFIGKQSEFK